MTEHTEAQRETLCKGRAPSATASLRREGTDLEGRIQCYDTPLGLLMFAQLKGERSVCEEVYRFGFFHSSKATQRASRCLPLLYARNGEAYGCMLTQRIGLGELMSGGLYVGCLSDAKPETQTFVLGQAAWDGETTNTDGAE